MILTAKQILDMCRSGILVYSTVDIGGGETLPALIPTGALALKMAQMDPDTRIPRARVDDDGDIYFRGNE